MEHETVGVSRGTVDVDLKRLDIERAKSDAEFKRIATELEIVRTDRKTNWG
jgi:hypothetical protein